MKKRPIVKDTTSYRSTDTSTGGSKRLIYLVLLVILGIFFYMFWYKNPQRVLSESVKNLGTASSYTTELKTVDDFFIAKGNIHEYPKQLSQVSFTFKNPEDKAQAFGVEMVVSEDDLYAMPKFINPKPEEVEAMISEMMPFIVSSKTYELIKPVFNGEKWLHVDMRTVGNEQKNRASKEKGKPVATKEQEKEMKDIARNSVIIRKYDGSHEFEGKRYQRIAIGFKKEELVRLLEKTKELNVDIKVSQINSTIDIVKGAKNWDDDIVVLLIDNYNNIVHATVSAPHIPDEVIEKSMDQAFGPEPTPKVEAKDEDKKDALAPDKGSTVKKLFTVRFSNHNAAPIVEKPKDIIEGKDLLVVAQEEFAPLITAFMEGGMRNLQMQQ